MVFEVQGKTDNYIRLSKDERDGAGIEFLSSRDLVEYQIQMEALQFKSVNNISQGIVKFVFRHGPLENWTQHSICIPYKRHYISASACIPFTPFFTAVYIVEPLVLQKMCVLKKEILQYLGLYTAAYNRERLQIKSGINGVCMVKALQDKNSSA